MKKIISFLSVLFFGLVLIGCGTKTTTTIAQTDEEAVAEAEGLIILDVEATNVLKDFYLTKTVIGNGVEVVWTSDNADLVKIVKENAKLEGDAKEYEYWKAEVTLVPLGGSATTVKLTATLTKGEVTSTVTEKVRIAVDEMLTLAEVRKATTGDIIKTKGVVTYRNPLAVSYNNFSVYMEDETSGLMLYRISGDYYDDFAPGNEVEVTGEVAPYQGLYEIKNVSLLKVHSTGNKIDEPTDITSLIGQTEVLENLQSKWVTIKGNFTAKVEPDGSKFHLYLMNGDTKVIEVYYHGDNLTDLAEKGEEVKALNGLTITEVTGVMGWYSGPQIICTAYDKVVVGVLTDDVKVNADLAAAQSLFAAEISKDVEVTLPTTGAQGSTLTWEVTSEDKTVLTEGKVIVAQGSEPVTVTLKVTATLNGVTKDATITFTVAAANNDPINVTEFLALAVGTKVYISGVIKEIQNPTFGNVVITDGTNDVLVYGIYKNGAKYGDWAEAEKVLAVGDVVYLNGERADFNGTPQVGGKAEFEKVDKYATVTEFLALAEGTKTLVKGEIKEIQNATFGNVVITDGTSEVLVYGIYKNGVKYGDWAEAEKVLAVGDVVYLSGERAAYNGTPQVGGKAEFVLVLKAEEKQEEEKTPVNAALTQVTSTEQLYDGAQIVIGYKNFLMGAYDSSKSLFASVTLEEEINVTSDVLVVTLVKTGDNWALQIGEGQYISYDNAAGGNKAYVSTTADESAQWTITVTEGVATITNVGTTERLFQYNAGSPRFVCYKASSNQCNTNLYIVAQ